jgi:prepilin-type N-terminal cleavage/methylation domain-containing protein
MKTHSSLRKRGFTLLETVIAIGVLAVLLTGFIIVFAPAAAGIKKSINVQEADRLATTLEQELVTLRGTQQQNDYKTGFGKAFIFLKAANNANDALLIYQYRGSLSNQRPDGTPTPLQTVSDKLPGKDYIVQTMMRRKSDTLFTEDLAAVEGGVYLVKCKQLVFTGGELKAGTAGKIVDPKNSGTEANTSDEYPEAVIAFSADFYTLPAKSAGYFTSQFTSAFSKAKTPVFSRNLAVRR